MQKQLFLSLLLVVSIPAFGTAETGQQRGKEIALIKSRAEYVVAAVAAWKVLQESHALVALYNHLRVPEFRRQGYYLEYSCHAVKALFAATVAGIALQWATHDAQAAERNS